MKSLRLHDDCETESGSKMYCSDFEEAGYDYECMLLCLKSKFSYCRLCCGGI